MTSNDRAVLEDLATRLEKMGVDDLRVVPTGDDPWALARAIRAVLAADSMGGSMVNPDRPPHSPEALEAERDAAVAQCASAERALNQAWQALDAIAAGPQGDDSFTAQGHREAVEMARTERPRSGVTARRDGHPRSVGMDPKWKLPLAPDNQALYIWDADQQMIAEIRGWGHLTGVGGLRLDDEAAIDAQKARAAALCEAVNERDALRARVAALEATLSHIAAGPSVPALRGDAEDHPSGAGHTPRGGHPRAGGGETPAPPKTADAEPRQQERLCVTCGKSALASRGDVLPECVGPDGMAACTFDMTADEAWQYWRQQYHELREQMRQPEAVRVLEEVRREIDEHAEAVADPRDLLPYEAARLMATEAISRKIAALRAEGEGGRR